ncbi:MAG TPA: NBR1-Ig-like domain-containing protein [Anaerolineaceae bacterium]|nr:NBR1-Ig-like domain-containing protein [Anaerolineaceae bacterium]
MRSIKKILIGTLVLVTLITLSGCGKVEPTLSADDLRTQAAQTVQAWMTATAAAQPTPQPTWTLAPTNTPEPPTPTVAVATSAITVTQVAVTPSATQPAAGGSDRGLWISQTPTDNTSFAPGADFSMTWRIKNTGTTTWTTGYQLRYYAGSGGRMNAVDISFPREVKPQEEVDLTLTMKAPATGGTYDSIWVLTNPNGANFYSVTITIKVEGAAATATTAATETPTNTPEPTLTPTP